MNTALTFRELTDDAEVHATWPLVHRMKPDIDEAHFIAMWEEMRGNGVRYAAAYAGNGQLLGAASFWVGMRLYCGRYLQIDNLVVDEARRSQGIGTAFLRWFEALAREAGCARILLDAVVENHASHKLYLREGFIIRGYHFNKWLE